MKDARKTARPAFGLFNVILPAAEDFSGSHFIVFTLFWLLKIDDMYITDYSVLL